MKKFIEDIKINEEIETYFIVLEKEKRTSQKNQDRKYLQILLGDKTGKIRAKIFDDVDELNKQLDVGDVILVKTRIQEYPYGSGTKQIILKKDSLRKLEKTEYNEADLIPKTKANVEDMLEIMRSEVQGFKNQFLKKLIDSFFEDKEFMLKFKRCPGAKVHHHMYLGGLVEHTFSVFKICKTLCEMYDLDKELVLSGAILHDVGKTMDYKIDLNIEITDFGGLVGHIIGGVQLVDQKIKQIPGFPEELRLRILHIIVSHHGNGEWGSPIEPRFKESMAVHLADHLDSNLFEFINHQTIEDKNQTAKWSSFIRPLDRMLFLGQRNLEEENEK